MCLYYYIIINIIAIINILLLHEPTAIPSRRKWVSQRLVCSKRELLQGRLPVKFTVLKCKHEIFVRIDMKHSYFSNYFIICLQSTFSVVESAKN